jgi:two-component system, cell cycle sensor histidine kinase and response regulator CckA
MTRSQQGRQNMTERDTRMALVVDDEPAIRAMTRRTLEKAHWTVLEARDGGEALRMIESGARIQLLLTDVVMPVMTGIELVATLRKSGVRIPALYLTAHADLIFVARSVLRDGEAFLTKPFTPKGLLEAVRDLGTTPAALPVSGTPFQFPAWFDRRRG